MRQEQSSHDRLKAVITERTPLFSPQLKKIFNCVDLPLGMADRREFLLGALGHFAAASAHPGEVTAPETAAEPITDIGCKEPRDDLAEVLLEVPAHSVQINQLNSISGALLSPDGKTLAVRNYRELAFVSVADGTTTVFPLGGPEFGVTPGGHSNAWSSDSDSIWFLKGDLTRSGFVTSPLRCARRLRDGSVVLAPPLTELPGRLDEVTWVDGGGLGVAHCDTRGGYNRPELPNRYPALAIFDAANGAVRTVLSLHESIRSTWGEGEGSIYLQVLATARLQDGRVRALLRCALVGQGRNKRLGGLALWTEGSQIQELPSSLNEPHSTAVFTPDGEALLVSFRLSAAGVIYERRPSPPPISVTGRYVALFDLRGKAIWLRSGTAHHMRGTSPLAVSPDGQLGLVILPERCGGDVWGLLDLRDGTIVRRLRRFGQNRVNSVGFAGEQTWFTSYQTLEFYD
ncbi:hypothetical protein [Brevundimonas sp.]|uniref:hypothetical protein n=1 Tax=Brevundimonas sp. TaxID=1871086 RepID=UPI0035AF037E